MPVTDIQFPLWLIILLGILVCLAIIAILYKIIAYRRISIVAKKTDYLVEDLIYKSEYLTPSFEAITKIANYIDLFEAITKKNSEALMNYVVNNKESVFKFSSQLKEIIREKK